MDQKLYQAKTERVKVDIPIGGLDKMSSTSKKFNRDSAKEAEVMGKVKRRMTILQGTNPSSSFDERLKQFNSQQYLLPDGRANVNHPLERSVIESKLADEIIQDNIITLSPVQKKDVHKVKAMKALMDFVNQKADTDKESRKAKLLKNVFGYCGWFEGIITESRYKFDPDGVPVFVEMSKLGGFAISPNDFLIDIQADIKDSQDAFYFQRGVSQETLRSWENRKDFKNIDLAIANKTMAPRLFQTDQSFSEDAQGESYDVVHYFSLSGKYVIFVGDTIIYDGFLPYKHGQLPISILIDHEKVDSMLGVGEPELLMSTKFEINTIKNQLIDAAKFSNQINIAANNNVSFESMEAIGGMANILRINSSNVNDSLTYLKPPSMDSSLLSVHEQLMRDVTVITGIDPTQILGSPAKTAWEARNVEQNKAKRISLCSELTNFFWQRVYSQRLSNIQQFFSSTTAYSILDEEAPEIRVPNTSVTALEKGGYRFKPSQTDGFFKVTDDLLDCDLDVLVQTPSTTSILKELKKEDFVQVFNNVFQTFLATGSTSLKSVIDKLDFEKIISKQLFNVGESLDDYLTSTDVDTKKLREEALKDIPRPPSPVPFDSQQMI